jgi:hypothetical protein
LKGITAGFLSQSLIHARGFLAENIIRGWKKGTDLWFVPDVMRVMANQIQKSK